MVKKGKKKKQQTQEPAQGSSDPTPSTSTSTSDSKQQVSQKQPAESKQQPAPPIKQSSQQQSQQQTQIAKNAPSKKEREPRPQTQQPAPSQPPHSPPPQQSQQVPSQPPQQPSLQSAWPRPQQSQQIIHQPPRQQVPSQPQWRPPTQQPPFQSAWSRPQQSQQIMQQPLRQQVPSQPRWGPPPQQPQQISYQPPPSQQPPLQSAWSCPQQPQQTMQQPLRQQVPSQPRWGPPPQQPQQISHQPSQQPPLQSAWPRPQQPQQTMQQPLRQQVPSQPRWGQQQPLMQQEIQYAAGDQQASNKKPRGDIIESDDAQSQASTSSQLSPSVSKLSVRDTQKSYSVDPKKSKPEEYQLCIPKRRHPMKAGTKGKRIMVQTNMFEVIFGKDFVTNAIHYDIEITPTAPKFLLRKVFEACRSQKFPNRFPAFDGKKNAYSGKDLPFTECMTAEIEIYDEERKTKRIFTIAFQKKAEIDLSWIRDLRPGIEDNKINRTGIQVLEIIMSHAPASRLTPVGRSFFSISSYTPTSLGEGMDLYIGAFQSVALGWKPYLNVDVSHKGFPKPQKVIDLMAEFCGNEQLTAVTIGRYQNNIHKFLKGLKVTYLIPNIPSSKRTHRLSGLGPTARNHRFDSDGTQYTIEQYFTQIKRYKLRYPDLPCVHVSSQTNKEIYLPAELCTIVAGQAINKTLGESQKSTMIKHTTTKPDKRMTKIQTAYGMIDVNNSPVMTNEFHLQVGAEFKKVEARILLPPELQYGGSTQRVSKGAWHAKPFSQAVRLEKDTWTFLNLYQKDLVCKIFEFKDKLKDQAKQLGMTIGDPQTPFEYIHFKDKDVMASVIHFFEVRKNLKLVIVILPDCTDAIYSKVKKIAELQVGVLTQCIKKTNLCKCEFSIINNILLKLNAKLNGINHTFTAKEIPFCLRNTKCMLVGADVSHPSPDAENIPSVAAVVASEDATAFKYNVEIRLQEAKQEIIVDFENILLEQIEMYRNTTGTPPTTIIFYRDGVSEGQLEKVLDSEIGAMRRACKQYAHRDPKFNPKITCLVVQKRHHVRLFPTDSDKLLKGNVHPGTIVDKEITHPNHIDFYLVSHASIQGTARPTKYRCICNESNFSEDNLEELTFHLCYIYARCTRAVNIPAPTYYAHLAAARGRDWIIQEEIETENLKKEQGRKLNVKMNNNPMYFI